MPAKLPSSMLRQHAARFAGRNMDRRAYREKRRLIIDGLLTMHGDIDPLDATDPLTVLEEAASQRRARARRRGLLLGAVASATIALTLALPSTQLSWQSVSAGLAASSSAHSSQHFLNRAQQLASKPGWNVKDVRPVLAGWDELDHRQRYAMRRYQAYSNLLGSGSAKANELLNLAEVSTQPGGLVRQSRRIHALLKRIREV